MRSNRPSAHTAIVSLEGATAFTPILDSLAARLGAGWTVESSRACDGTSLLLVSASAEEVDLSLAVSEIPTGFAIDELKADHLTRIGECRTLDELCSLVVRHLFQVPRRLGLAIAPHARAA